MAGMEGYTRLPSRSKGQVIESKLGAEFLNQRVAYKGIFDLNELYKIIYDWLVSRGFQVHESKYQSAVMDHGGKDIRFEWYADRKGTELVMVIMKLHFKLADLQQIEVEKNGEKKKLVKGYLFIRITQDCEFDFNERYSYNKWHQTILKFMTEWMMQKKIETYWEDKARFKAYELANVIKESLDMMTKGNEHYDVW